MKIKKMLNTVGIVTITNSLIANALYAANDADSAAACGACGGGMIFLIILPIVIQVALLAWVVKDARSRGIESPIGWMVFVFFVPLIGILVYIFSRPQKNDTNSGQ